MIGRKRKIESMFDESLISNTDTYLLFYSRLKNIAISMFKWDGLPESVNERYLEMCLYETGSSVFFKDELLGYLSLKTKFGAPLNVYGEPEIYDAYANNNYLKPLTQNDSVIIYNNYLHTNALNDIDYFALRLYNIERTIDVNINAQKTPVLIECDENERLTFKNIYQKWAGNVPFIFGRKGLAKEPLRVLKTDAPYLCDKLYQLKVNYWNEALTYLGIPSVSVNKKERLLSDEVNTMQGGALASRFSRLGMRQIACEKINSMFGLNISVSIRDFEDSEIAMPGKAEEDDYNEPIYDRD